MIRPFSNGTEFEMWDEQNCGICQNSSQNSDDNIYKCHIDEAMTNALLGYGEVKDNIINLIGFDDRHFLKECKFKDLVLKPVVINVSVFKQLSLF